MTHDELLLIKDVLAKTVIDHKIANRAREIITKELDCSCPKSANPNCSVHGVSAQLERSQME